jgi:hypothetical protein
MFKRNYLLKKPTVTEHQIASRLAKTLDPNNHNTNDDSLVQIRLRQKSKWVHNLIIHYTDEARLASYKKDIHQLWNYIFKNTPVMNTKLIIGHRNSRSVTKTLLH